MELKSSPQTLITKSADLQIYLNLNFPLKCFKSISTSGQVLVRAVINYFPRSKGFKKIPFKEN